MDSRKVAVVWEPDCGVGCEAGIPRSKNRIFFGNHRCYDLVAVSNR
jgi:hypothetical protein